MKRNHTLHRILRSQAGVTLVELMVALLLGLIITSGVIQIFISNRATYAFNEGLARIQENGRSAIDALTYNVRMSGFLGCLSAATTVHNNLNSSTTLAFNFEEGIRGYEGDDSGVGAVIAPTVTNPANATAVGDWTPALPVLLGAIPNSDVLVVRNVSSSSNSLRSPFVSATKVMALGAAANYQVGDIAVVSDCQKASVFQITNVADTTAGGVATFELSHVAAGTPGNATPTWGTDQEYSAGAQLMLAETWVYYVGARPGDGAPALFQQRLQSSAGTVSALAPEELIEHVETMQITYGVDNELDGDVDSYVTADAVGANWNRVAAVRVGLVMRSPDEYGTELDERDYFVNGATFDPLDDRRIRQVFTTTIAIRNRLP